MPRPYRRLLFDWYAFAADDDDRPTGSFNVCVTVAVVSLLPRLDRSGGGGRGCPVIECCCCSHFVVENDRELRLDVERLSSLLTGADDDDDDDNDE